MSDIPASNDIDKSELGKQIERNDLSRPDDKNRMLQDQDAWEITSE